MHNCNIRAAQNLKATTYLGRPWGTLSRTVYIESFIDNIIDETGWHVWLNKHERKINSLYYGKYKNYGSGFSTSHRVTWKGYHAIVDPFIAANFTVSNFISGDSWLPLTRVPYIGGLISF